MALDDHILKKNKIAKCKNYESLLIFLKELILGPEIFEDKKSKMNFHMCLRIRLIICSASKPLQDNAMLFTLI